MHVEDPEPPWDRYPRWRESQRDLLSLMALARKVRDGVIDDLAHRHDDPLSWGVTFFVRWRGLLTELAVSDQRIAVINFQRGVFAFLGVPFRLYRAGLEDLPPRRVLAISEEERRARQLCLFDSEGGNDSGPNRLESSEPEAEASIRIRAVPGIDERIAEFVFEELASDGTVIWSWGIRAEETPRVLTLLVQEPREPIELPPPLVVLRGEEKKKEDSESDE